MSGRISHLPSFLGVADPVSAHTMAVLHVSASLFLPVQTGKNDITQWNILPHVKLLELPKVITHTNALQDKVNAHENRI